MQDLKRMNQFYIKTKLPQNVDAAVAVGQKEHIIVVVPGNFIDLKLKLFFSTWTVSLCINESHHIILIPNSNGLTIRTPTYVDVLS